LKQDCEIISVNFFQDESNEQPTHKTAHLQIAQADTQPKFAKEQFSCHPTNENIE